MTRSSDIGRVSEGRAHRQRAAERLADQDRALVGDLTDQTMEVGDEIRHRCVGIVWQRKRDDVECGSQEWRLAVEEERCPVDAGHENDRRRCKIGVEVSQAGRSGIHDGDSVVVSLTRVTAGTPA